MSKYSIAGEAPGEFPEWPSWCFHSSWSPSFLFLVTMSQESLLFKLLGLSDCR